MAALPRNQAMPNPVSKTPNPVLRRFAGITRASAAALTDARKKIRELVGELLAGGGTAHRRKAAGRGARR